jgi:hypothetical protein
MADQKLLFDREYFVSGESAFARGVSLADLIEAVNRTIADPHADAFAVSGAQRAQWAEDQEKREQQGVGYILGYANGALQAIRRLDQTINTPRP